MRYSGHDESPFFKSQNASPSFDGSAPSSDRRIVVALV